MASLLVAIGLFFGLQTPTIENLHFERGLAGWDIATFGARPTVVVEPTAGHDRDPALKISSVEPSDAAVGRDIPVRPGALYRLGAWVKTEAIDPRDAPVFGAIQVQQAGGRGVVASGPSRRGTTDRNRVTVEFLAPISGMARIAIFLAGWGRGTGAIWVSGVSLAECNLDQAPITVTNRPLNPGKIDPGQYGQFIEYLCNLVPGMWAEKLYDGSFEGLSPYKFVFLKETDFKERPWVPSGAVNRSEVTQDREHPVSGDCCERISVPAGAPCVAGIKQSGIAVQQGVDCDFSCWTRAKGFDGKTTVTLRDEAGIVDQIAIAAGPEWSKQRAALHIRRSSIDATLSIEFDGPGTLWLDNASLMPRNNLGGWRPDVVRALTELKPGVIRVGGSVMDDINLGDFEWKDTVGDVDRRKPFRAWGGLQPVGPGLEEVVQLIQRVGAEPLICVRVTNRTPADAAEEIQYFNGSAATPMGALRAKNGHPQPYRIRYWQIGNERAGAEYDRRLPEFCAAMRAADPTIKLLSSFPTEGAAKAGGDQLDFLCPHHYGCNDLPSMKSDFDNIRSLIARYGHGRDIRVAVTEWNTTAGDAGPARAMLWTLQNAIDCARYQNLLHRQCDLVSIANRSNLTNSFCSGIIQTDSRRMFLTPTYYAQRLYSTLGGRVPLALESATATDLAPDISATLSEEGKTLTLFAVNSSVTDISRTLDLTQLHPKLGTAEVWTLADGKDSGMPDAANSFDEPNRIDVRRSTMSVRSARPTFRFPRLSIVAIRISVATP